MRSPRSRCRSGTRWRVGCCFRARRQRERYVVFVALSSVRPIFAFESGGGSAFEYRDLAGAVLIGVCCALGARLFTRLIRFAKTVTLGPIVLRVVLSGLCSGCCS